MWLKLAEGVQQVVLMKVDERKFELSSFLLRMQSSRLTRTLRLL